MKQGVSVGGLFRECAGVHVTLVDVPAFGRSAAGEFGQATLKRDPGAHANPPQMLRLARSIATADRA
jgi:hypothetical protein